MRALPLLQLGILVVEAEVPPWEPPLHRPSERGPVTPAARVAPTFTTSRVVEPPKDG